MIFKELRFFQSILSVVVVLIDPRSIICDTIKQNESELTNTDFKI